MDQIDMQRTWLPISRSEKNVGHDTIEFILHKDKTNERRATYMRAVYDMRTQKTQTNITSLTTGGNLIDYLREVSTAKLDLSTMKLHVNSSISDVKSRYTYMDVKKNS